MAKVRSGFKQIKRKRQKTSFTLLVTAFYYLKKVASTEIPLPAFLQRKSSRMTGSRAKNYLKRDIHKQQFTNPYAKQRRMNSIIEKLASYRLLASTIVLVGLMIYIWILLFGRSTFYITRLSILGNVETSTDDIEAVVKEHLESRSLVIIQRSHRLFLNLDKLDQKLQEQFNFSSIEYTPDWPSKSMTIMVKEKDPVMIYSLNDTYYSVDQSGTIIREITEEEKTNLQNSIDIPILYNYNDLSEELISIDQQYVASTTYIENEFNKYPNVSVHSYRLRQSPQNEVVINETLPEVLLDQEAEQTEDELESAAEEIASGETIEEKINSLKDALSSLDIEKVEEGSIDKIFQQRRVYKPSDDYQLLELEVLTDQGWTLRLGHQALKDVSEIQKQLNIFATLNRELDMEGEVKEYIDLRFPNRVYYR